MAPGRSERASGGRPRNTDADVAILDTTVALLRDRGYNELRIEDVAAATGHAKTTVYRRWPTLRHLVVAAMEHALGGLPEVDDDEPVGAIITLLRHRSRTLDQASLLGVGLELVRGDDHDLASTYRKRLIDPVRDEIIDLLGVAADRGLIGDKDPKALADAILGGLVYRAAVLGRPVRGNGISTFVTGVIDPE